MRTARPPSADDSSAVLQTYGPRSADGSSTLPDISSTIDRHKYIWNGGSTLIGLIVIK